VGILGGTFDPPHVGHLAIAGAALKALKLSKIIFIPALVQPHKTQKVSSSPTDRLNMLRLALDGCREFEISEMELQRRGRSFTVDTLEELKRIQPSNRLFLIIGADNVSEIETWRNPERIFELATVAAANRPGFQPTGRYVQDIVYFDMPDTNVSSTEIREKVKVGISVNRLISTRVEKYIRENKLYLNDG
jgi:nicotinate-nucleotide adenylyltransferase